MRKLVLLVIALAFVSIGYRGWTTSKAQHLGPFAEFGIDPSNHASINTKLDAISAKFRHFKNVNEAKQYAELIGFTCRTNNSKSKTLIGKRIWVNYDSIILCGYKYGFWGDEIVFFIYINENNGILKVKSSDIFKEM